MNSDDDCDIFSAKTNVTAITKLNDGNNSDDGNSISVLSKLCLLKNDGSIAMTLHICSFLYHLLILSGVVPTVKKKKDVQKEKDR